MLLGDILMQFCCWFRQKHHVSNVCVQGSVIDYNTDMAMVSL
jgi:hypothetical protein